MLLSVNPNSGRITTKQKIDYGLMGAELVRLAAVGRVDIEAGRVLVRDAAATGDPRLDATLASLAGSSRPPKAERWVGHPRRKILDSYLEPLVAAGCLRREGTMLTRWRIDDTGRTADAKARLDSIATSTGQIDLTQTALGGLAYAIGLVNVLYPGWGNRGIRKRFREIADGQWTEPPSADVPDAPDAGPADSAGAGAASHHTAVHGAGHAATHAASQAATHAATHADTHAAVHAATHAAVHAAVHASVDAGHSAAAGGGHGGH